MIGITDFDGWIASDPPLVLIVRPTVGGTVGAIGCVLSAGATGLGGRVFVFGQRGLCDTELTSGSRFDVIRPAHVTDRAEGFRPTGDRTPIFGGIDHGIWLLLSLYSDCVRGGNCQFCVCAQMDGVERWVFIIQDRYRNADPCDGSGLQDRYST